ncbi:hypothetical protein HK099_002916 [Clydaea vesicula]|uniref:Uncharacterized protein n=1 Tax=Clydaea vesicula TaxID=447962 RepID=A0AAD5UB20_9FUNG|nr:hypothetical protein HK099_002916 [Clydaea vesicula]
MSAGTSKSTKTAKTNNTYIFSKDAFKVPPKSQVLVYELELKEIFERYQTTPSRERAAECFRIFNEILPYIGAFSSILTTIKDELYRSVYSQDLTSKSAEPYLERIPYFKSVKRLEKLRNEECAKMQTSESDLQQKLKFKEQDLQISYKKSLFLKEDVYARDVKIAKLTKQIEALEEQQRLNESEKTELKICSFQKEKDLENKVESYKISLAQSNHIIEKLSVFKTSYVENADMIFEDVNKLKRANLEMTPEAMLKYDIIQGEQLELQFCEMLDYQLDDFETSISQLQRKKEVLNLVSSSSSGSSSTTEDRENSHRLEMRDINVGFKKRVSDLLEEQNLLKIHVDMLKSNLEKITSEEDVKVRRNTDEGKKKYAIKTLFCPHRLSEVEIALPSNVTNLKFVHPNLNFQSKIALKDSENEEVVDLEDSGLDKTYLTIWTDFYENKMGKKPRVFRIFPLPKLLAFIQDIYNSRWSFEDGLDENACWSKSKILRFSDYFYDFMEKRYQIKNISLKTIFDIISSLYANDESSLRVQIFTKILSGEQDATWKYFYLIEKLLLKYEPMDLKQYHSFLQILYPGRTKEIYDQMELEFTAFSKNHLTKEMIEEHIMHMIVTDIEPNYTFYLNCMKKIDIQRTGTLCYDDFDEAIGHILPVAGSNLKRVRYCITKADFEESQLPTLERLSYCACYVGLQNCFENNWTPQTMITAENIEMMTTVKVDDEEEKEKNTEKENAGKMNFKYKLNNDLVQKEVESALAGGSIAGKFLNQDDIDEEAAKLSRRVDMISQKEAGKFLGNNNYDAGESSDEEISTEAKSELIARLMK